MNNNHSKFKLTLFPGRIIPPPSDRCLDDVLAPWIDKDGSLMLSESAIPPTLSTCSKLVFKRDTASGKIEFVGSAVSETTYTQMADFAFTSPHISGPAISKQSVPQNYNFEGNPQAKLVAAKLQTDEGAVAFLRFKDISDPPSQPTASVLAQSADPSSEALALLHKVQQLFQERPVWQRASLEDALALGPLPAWRLAAALRLVSYLFLDGPWRKCYVRFGFDPRKELSARPLQMIDFRDPFFKTEEGARASTTENRNIDIHFRRAPTNRSQLYQLCDIEDPAIQALLNASSKVDEADPHTGWLTEVELDAIRNQMKIKSESMRRNAVFK